MQALSGSLGRRVGECPASSQAWANLGRVLGDFCGDYVEAEKAWRKAVALDAGLSSMWAGLAGSLVELKRYKEAESAYLTATEQSDVSSEAWNGLGILRATYFGEYVQAEDAFKRATEVGPEPAVGYFNLGRLLTEYLGRHDEAEKALRKGLKLDSSNASAWCRLGDVLSKGQGRKC